MKSAIIAAFFVSLTLGGCSGGFGSEASAQRLEHDVTASCRAWDGYALEAANPSPATIARHDAMMQKVYALEQQPSADPGQIAQIKIDADALYDAQGKKQIADQCWAELGMVRDMHAEQSQREHALADAAQQHAAERAQQSLMPRQSDYTLHTALPQAPQPNPIQDLGKMYVPPPPMPHGCIGVVPVPGQISTNPCPD